MSQGDEMNSASRVLEAEHTFHKRLPAGELDMSLSSVLGIEAAASCRSSSKH